MPGFSEDHLRQRWIAQHHIFTAANVLLLWNWNSKLPQPFFSLSPLFFSSFSLFECFAAPTMVPRMIYGVDSHSSYHLLTEWMRECKRSTTQPCERVTFDFMRCISYISMVRKWTPLILFCASLALSSTYFSSEIVDKGLNMYWTEAQT